MVKPPWSGQSVRPWVRFLAWIFLILALLAGVAAAFLIIRDGKITAEQLPVIFFLIGEMYFFALLLHVVIKGVAPTTWLPWK